MKSKIIFFSIITISLVINMGCGDKFTENLRDKHIIPYVSAESHWDMTDTEL